MVDIITSKFYFNRSVPQKYIAQVNTLQTALSLVSL